MLPKLTATYCVSDLGLCREGARLTTVFKLLKLHSVGETKVIEKKRRTREKNVSMPVCPPHIPQGQTWHKTWASMLTGALTRASVLRNDGQICIRFCVPLILYLYKSLSHIL
jgi:hypothetical protein